MIGVAAKILVSGIVLLFLGLQSLNFFYFVFPTDQWFYAYLGFGLTSGGVILYLLMFKLDSDNSKFKKTVAVSMMVICVIGEILTAGFGMQIEGLQKLGYTMSESDYDFMILAVQLLALLHGIALIAYFSGDDIAELFDDDDQDGVPNYRDKDWRKRPQQQTHAFASDEKAPDGHPNLKSQ
jgi:hypothetical protein